MVSTFSHLPLAPLGAGDLIDRAVRLYRRHLFTLIRIATPPVVVSAIGSVLVGVAWRSLDTPSGLMLLFYIFLLILGGLVFVAGYIFSLIVMGGATRNLVTHLLWDQPVSMRATYDAVRSRFWGLLVATLIMVAWVWISVMVAGFSFYLVMTIVGVSILLFAQIGPAWVTVMVLIVGSVMGTAVAVWVFFFFVGRVAYVPQVMLVEGKGIFASVSRSFSLARGNVRRLMAMTLFVSFAFYSALMVLVAPLAWYGWLNGVDVLPWNAAEWPAWYAIGNGVLEPLSRILLAPIWMLGLSLLYVDERVRHEGYDIELMASRQLGPMPELNVVSPYAPAISVDRRTLPPPPLSSSGKVLGLG
ncbi:MAG: hypothetical protein ND895_18340 [Pyrinomonadaceae bacterium]|nr:hypothetical protein [Pyrinomonadaceae bacterium]